MGLKEKADEIKRLVSVPSYFKDMIIPEMPGYYSDYTVDFEVKPVVKCPLHGEDTPSFRYYDETNTFYCFGCGAGGDIIQLHIATVYAMTGAEVHFEEAVNFLYERFINQNEGKNLTGAMGVVGLGGKPIKDTTSIEQLSSTAELLRLGRYLSNLEDRLTTNEFKQWQKEKLYKHIDNIHLLISMDIIRAKDALQFIKGMESKVLSSVVSDEYS